MSYSRSLARIARQGPIVVGTAADLRDLASYGGIYPEYVETKGVFSADDGGGGTWRWDAASTAADNTGTVLLPTEHVGAGRWLRVGLDAVPVSAFGIVPSVADCRALFAVAFSANVTLSLPNAALTLEGFLTIPAGVRLKGHDGGNSILRVNANTGGLNITGEGISLSGFGVESDRAVYTATSNHGIYSVTGGWSGLSIEKVTVRNWGGAGMLLLGAVGSPVNGCKITDCTVDDVGAHGIILQSFIDHSVVSGCTVSNYSLTYADRPGITVGRDGKCNRVLNNNVIASVDALGTAAHGISVEGTDGIVRGNYIERGSYGIELVGSRHSAIDNRISLSKQCGIAFVGSETLQNTDALIQGNTITNPGLTTTSGMLLRLNSSTGSKMKRAIVANNIIVGAFNVGIELTAVADSVITGNYINGTSKSGIWGTNVSALTVANNAVHGCNTSVNAAHGGIIFAAIPDASLLVITNNSCIGNGLADQRVYTAGGALRNLEPPMVQFNPLSPAASGLTFGHSTPTSSFNIIGNQLQFAELRTLSASAPATTSVSTVVRSLEVTSLDGLTVLGYIPLYSTKT